jgi:thiol-disulfide isomerase/thioredoxin
MEEVSGDDCFRVLDDSKMVLFYFTASWCGPCQRIYPMVKDLSEKISDKFRSL